MSFVFRNCLHFKVIWPNPSSSISFIVQCCSLPVDSTTTAPGVVGSYCALLPTAAVCVCILSFTCDLWFKGGNEVCFVPLPSGRPLRVILLSFVAISRNNCCEQKVCCEIAMHDLCYNKKKEKRSRLPRLPSTLLMLSSPYQQSPPHQELVGRLKDSLHQKQERKWRMKRGSCQWVQRFTQINW